MSHPSRILNIYDFYGYHIQLNDLNHHCKEIDIKIGFRYIHMIFLRATLPGIFLK